MNKKDMEKYSSAVTLSDMEIFIFPELLYSLVLANIMSPVIWSWKEDPWFKDINGMTPYKKILRLKQFIMDNFDFNLDLETWGLTTKEKEISRFKSFLDEDVINKSNALFGYEGDKYYFDIDIRKHFGIDKYKSNVIPYWKTETIEAMEAFKYKDAFEKGAGECVSISTLYAAALFIICKIPLENIYLLATPLHSQNFIDIRDGLITNNRRLVTKNMWFNGTKLTAKAQRAMRNEQVTIVSHSSGYIHVVYPEATMDIKAYDVFENKLRKFLITDVNFDILCNFLRQESDLQKCFQIKHIYNGKERYIGAEKAYAYESTSSFRVNESTLDQLLSEIDTYDFYSEPLEDRIFLNKFSDYFRTHKVDFHDKNNINKLLEELDCPHMRKNEILKILFEFCNLEPKLPGRDKIFIKTEPINLTTGMEREDIISYLESLRDKNTTADLAFYAYRDFSRIIWDPFIKAAVERNPVSIEGCEKYSDVEVIHIIENMTNQSIYDGSRIAQPDEVWNYQRGDGLERAICLANILKNRNRYKNININVEKDHVTITLDKITAVWPSCKGIEGNIKLDDHFS
ncbi:hypothetical protein LLG07_03865 [bacterium]|nr:hypothetical protein [bacterium]